MIETSGLSLGVESVFPQAEYERRVDAAREAMAARGVDALVVTGPENLFYLSGQQTPGYYTFQCMIVTLEGKPVFLLRQLELHNFRRNTFVTNVELYPDNAQPAEALVDQLTKLRLAGKRVAIEKRGWFLPIGFYERLADRLGSVADGSGIVEGLRRVKSPLELSMIEEAAKLTDLGVKAGLAAIRPGASENAVVAAMLSASISGGSEYLGMEPLVSSGPRSGIPHATWRRRTIEQDDPVFLEMASSYNRYHAALMRAAWVGTAPHDVREMMKVCREALEAALAAMRPGVTFEAVHDAAQAVIDRNGMTERYKKRTGYSLGISFAPDWGEWQVASLYTGERDVLAPGMVFHLPTALREYGVYTVGVSETAIVTETGCRTLSTVPRELIQV
ncbi:aminopeptidase P family protein [bacterium]|nr:MAG: aminopeptidase P family protein [bacterium]